MKFNKPAAAFATPLSHSARIIAHPGRGRSTRKPINLIDSVGPDFDVCSELVFSLDRYNGEESLTCRSVPNIIRYAVDALREQVEGKSPPPVRAVYSCCIYGGLAAVRGNPHIRALTRMKKLFLTSAPQGTSAYAVMQMYQMLDKFEVQLSDPMNSGVLAKLNTQTTKEIRAMVSDTARRTGLSGNEVSKLAIVATLAEQVEVRADFRELLQGMYDSTMLACDCRCDVIRTLLSRIGVEVPTDDAMGSEDDA